MDSIPHRLKSHYSEGFFPFLPWKMNSCGNEPPTINPETWERQREEYQAPDNPGHRTAVPEHCRGGPELPAASSQTAGQKQAGGGGSKLLCGRAQRQVNGALLVAEATVMCGQSPLKSALRTDLDTCRRNPRRGNHWKAAELMMRSLMEARASTEEGRVACRWPGQPWDGGSAVSWQSSAASAYRAQLT